MRASSFLIAVAALAAVSACREPPGPGDVLLPAIASGNAQVDTVGHRLPQPIAVRVNDANGRLVYGLTVVFRVTSGGGSVAPETASTRGGGLAQARWVLGTASADTQRLEASVLDPRTDQVIGAVRFRAIAMADRPMVMTIYPGNAQTGDVGAALTQLIGVQVRDRYENGVPGVLVTWRGDIVSGSVTPAESATDGRGDLRLPCGAQLYLTQHSLGTESPPERTRRRCFFE